MPQPVLVKFQALSAATGISQKALKEAFQEVGAPERLDKVECLKFIEQRFKGVAKLPPDLAQQKIIIDFEHKKFNRDKAREATEALRLKNLETHGKLVQRDEVRAQGAAVGVALSSLINEFELSGPAMCSGKKELELHGVFQEQCDKLRSVVRRALERLNGLRAAEEQI